MLENLSNRMESYYGESKTFENLCPAVMGGMLSSSSAFVGGPAAQSRGRDRPRFRGVEGR